MIRGHSLKESFPYISDLDDAKTEAEGATVFLLRSIPVEVRTRIQDEAAQFGDFGATLKPRNNQQYLELVRWGLGNVRNYKDEDDKDIPFETEDMPHAGSVIKVPTYDFLGTLDPRLIPELGKKILSMNTLKKEEAKN